MSATADQVSALAAHLQTFHDRRGDAPAAATFRQEVTFTRGHFMFAHGGVEVWSLTCDFGSARGLLWIEENDGADDALQVGPITHVISSARLGELYPELERRSGLTYCANFDGWNLSTDGDRRES